MAIFLNLFYFIDRKCQPIWASVLASDLNQNSSFGCTLSLFPMTALAYNSFLNLFTGCDTGFGFELAKHLHSLQCKVYAGCLFKDGDGGKELAELGIDVIQLDVTKEEEWDLAIEHIQQTSKQLWGLVNNAGT